VKIEPSNEAATSSMATSIKVLRGISRCTESLLDPEALSLSTILFSSRSGAQQKTDYRYLENVKNWKQSNCEISVLFI